MIRSLILKRLDSEERALGVSLDYLRHIVRISLPSFFKFFLFMPLSKNRRSLPASPYSVGRIVATRDEDCGTCVQIEVNLAKKARVPLAVLQAVLQQKPEDLPEDLADVYRFTEAVVKASGGEAPYRERIIGRYGQEAFVELSLAIAAARLFPIIKRSLGYAVSCSLVEVKV